MLAEQWRRKIVNPTQTDGSVRVAGLKKKMGVSPEIVRRDLEDMEAQGLIRHTREGAFLTDKEEAPGERTIRYQNSSVKEREDPESKVEIAEFTVRFIKGDQPITLDSGTTAYELARAIKRTLCSLTVVTDSIAILNKLANAKGIVLIATGGVYYPEGTAFVSDITGMTFSELGINTFFPTTCGISADRGTTHQHMDETIVQEEMIEASDQTIVIANSTKLGVNSLAKICDIDRMGMTIINPEASREQMRPFERVGVSVEKSEN